ncbi:hypothetical protein ACXR2W_00945 [Leucobacter sp. HY1908]
MSSLDALLGGSRHDLPMGDWDAGVDSNGQVFIARGGVTVGLTTELSEKIRAGFARDGGAESGMLEAIHSAICEDSLSDCLEEFGACARAVRAVREAGGAS